MKKFCTVWVGVAFVLLLTPCRMLSQVVEERVFEDAPFPACHAATIVETQEHELLTAFFGGAYEGSPDCCIWLCRKLEDGWSAPVKVAEGRVDGNPTACYNPVLYQIPGGDLLLFYKVGWCVQAWTGFMKRSSDGGRTWSEPIPLPKKNLGPIKNKPILLNQQLLCGSSLEKGGWRVYMELLDLQTQKWKKSKALNDRKGPIQVIQPTIFLGTDDTLTILCRSHRCGDPVMASRSLNQGRSWSPMFPVPELLSNNSGLDGVTLSDGRHLLIYNNVTHIDNPCARTPLTVALSEDAVHWTPVLELEDAEGQEFSYPAVIVDNEGVVHVVYTENRKHIKHAFFRIDDLILNKNNE